MNDQTLWKNDVIITATQRLAATLRARFQQTSAYQTLPSSEKKIFPLTEWLVLLWQQAVSFNQIPPATLLNEWQTQMVLENIITKDDHINTSQLSFITKECCHAFELLRNWEISLQTSDCRSSDHLLLLEWQRQLYEQCETQQWMPYFDLLPNIIQLRTAFSFSPIKNICFAGFDHYPPALLHLKNLLSEQNIVFTTYQPTNTNTSQIRYAFSDLEKEFEAMAEWASDIHQEHPHAHIACVLPNLVSKRKILQQHFQTSSTNIFNIAGGQPLIEYPIIYSAWLMLKILTGHLTREEWRYLLSAAFFNLPIEEKKLLPALVWTIEHIQTTHITVSEINKIFEQRHMPSLILFNKAVVTEHKNLQSLSEWIMTFQAVLDHWQWTGKTENNQHSAVSLRLLTLVEDIASSNLLIQPIDLHTALHQLHTQLQTTFFQEDIQQQKPIQILGILETAGLPFDYVWLANVHDAEWPRPLTYSRFLPQHIRKTLPIGSRTLQHDFAKHISQRLQNSSQHFVVSHATHNGDEKQQESIFFSKIPENLYTTKENNKKIMHQTSNPPIHMLKTNTWLPLLNNMPKGGSYLLSLQAACPFRAFSEIRLHAKKTDIILPVFDAKERGIILHAALQYFWETIHSQSILQNQSDEQIEKQLKTHIAKALSHVLKKRLWDCADIIVRTEKKRLLHLLRNWLTLEKQRATFEVIATEQRKTISIGPLQLKISIDRIDKVGDHYWLIDYKTSRTRIQDWLDEIPLAPQLPLYAITSEYPVDAIMFAEIRADNLQLQGLINNESFSLKKSSDAFLIKQSQYSSDWKTLTQRWQHSIITLAQDFYNGHAAVTPHNKNICTHCHLQTLCRIHEVSHENV